MMKDIVDAKALDHYRLFLRFEDGLEGVVDLTTHVRFEGVFEQLREPPTFNQVSVDPESGTVTWPNGADLDPDVLYAALAGIPVEDELNLPLTR